MKRTIKEKIDTVIMGLCDVVDGLLSILSLGNYDTCYVKN